MLARDSQLIRKLRGEMVWVGDVDRLANGEGIIYSCIANVGLVVIDELDDGEEIAVVAGASLRLGEVEGACTWGISQRRRRRRRASASCRRHAESRHVACIQNRRRSPGRRGWRLRQRSS